MSDDQVFRDRIVEGLGEFKNHINTCDRRYQEWSGRQEKTLSYLESLTNDVSALKLQIAEARGANEVIKENRRMGKWQKIIDHAITIGLGALGGAGSHIVLK